MLSLFPWVKRIPTKRLASCFRNTLYRIRIIFFLKFSVLFKTTKPISDLVKWCITVLNDVCGLFLWYNGRQLKFFNLIVFCFWGSGIDFSSQFHPQGHARTLFLWPAMCFWILYQLVNCFVRSYNNWLNWVKWMTSVKESWQADNNMTKRRYFFRM